MPPLAAKLAEINAEKKKVGKMAAASHDLAYRLSALAPLCILYD